MRLWKWFLVILGVGLVLGVWLGDASVLLMMLALAGVAISSGIVVWELKQVAREVIVARDRVEGAIGIGSAVLLCGVTMMTMGSLLALFTGR